MPSNFSRRFSKKFNRSKHPALQKVAKSFQSDDQTYELLQTQFCVQQEAAEKYHNELKYYTQKVEELYETQKRLHSSLREVLGQEGCPTTDLVQAPITQALDKVNAEHVVNLEQDVQLPLDQFMGNVPLVKAKMAKRDHLSMEYECVKIKLEQKEDEGDVREIQATEEEVREVRKMYEEVNGELVAELPALQRARLHYIINSFDQLQVSSFSQLTQI